MGRRFFAIVAALTVSCSAFANEGGEGGGGGEAAKTESKDAKSGSLPEWVEIQSKLQALRAKISAKDRAVRELIKDKEAEKDPKKNVEIVQNMKNEHHELRQAMEEYERQLNLLRYRFPEKGLKEEQRYKRMNQKSLEELEKQVSMEGRLKQVTAKVKRQYGEPETEEAPPAEEKKKEPELSGSESITAPPVLSK